jgi:hypothetical protein
MAQSLEKKTGCGGADRSGNGDQGADGPTHQVEPAGASGQIGDHQDCEDGDGRSADCYGDNLCTSNRLISAIASPGFRFFGQACAQLRIV